MYPGVRIFKIWGFDQISINIVENHRKLFSLWFYQIWTDILCLGSILSLFRGILTIFGHFRPFFNTAIYYDFTAISVLEIIAKFTAFYCIFQITEIYCDFSDSHCDFHPSCRGKNDVYRQLWCRKFSRRWINSTLFGHTVITTKYWS